MKKRDIYSGASKECPVDSNAKNPFIKEKWEEEFKIKNCILTFLNTLNRLREIYLQINSWTKKFKVKIHARKGEIRITKVD